MEPEGSLPYLQELVTCPCSEPGQTSTCPPPPPNPTLNIHFNIILPSMPGSSRRSLSLRFPHQTLHTGFGGETHPCYMARPSHSS